MKKVFYRFILKKRREFQGGKLEYMKKEIDLLDVEILRYLQTDARKSLKKLAEDLHKKTSTIYHRLQRLKSNNFILGYSVILNPEFLNFEKISFEKITLKPLNITSLDSMFVKSFAHYLKTEFENALFIALSEGQKVIYLVSVHLSLKDHDDFITLLKNNPYIENVETEFLNQIIKGQKLFDFNEKYIKTRKSKKVLAEEGEEVEGEEAEAEEELEDEEENIEF
jgi:DNA-binding Lrp family transcriptional regulator